MKKTVSYLINEGGRKLRVEGTPVGKYLSLRERGAGFIVEHVPSAGVTHVGFFRSRKAAESWAEWLNKEGGDSLRYKKIPEKLGQKIWTRILSSGAGNENENEKKGRAP